MGAADIPEYPAPRLRFSPIFCDCRSGRSGEGDESSSPSERERSNAASIRDFEGPGSAMVAEKRKGVKCRRRAAQDTVKSRPNLARLWHRFPTIPK